MSLTRTEAQERSDAGRPEVGCVREEGGSFPVDLYLSQDFVEFSERNRVSWSVFQYLRVVLRQYLDRRKNDQDKL